jgi:hypothetical protein
MPLLVDYGVFTLEGNNRSQKHFNENPDRAYWKHLRPVRLIGATAKAGDSTPRSGSLAGALIVSRA